MKWNAYANLRDGRPCHVGEKQWVAFHGCGKVHPVTVAVDPDGAFWGWHHTESPPDKLPTMIQWSKLMLDICFPMGADYAEKKGLGRVVRLSIEVQAE